jgi:mono/diheme cytochrome c family protein
MAALALALLGTQAAMADEASVERGRTLFDGKGGCSFCHGWAADGQGDPRSEGGAPSLRTSALDRDQVREVIQCGRPGTAMPYFDRFAYTDDRCYGLTEADLGPDMPTRSFTTLQAHEIDALADYVAAKVLNAGPVTFEQCVEFFGDVVTACGNYPMADGSKPDMSNAKPTPEAAAQGGVH